MVYPKIPRTPDSHASRGRGRILFLEKCAVCHGTTAEGNGPQTKDYGEDPITKEKYKEPGLFDAWGHPIQPRNLTLGIYRGGRRPLDIYRRVHEGIPGTPMASFATFKDEQIWDIVNYVLSIPYEGAIEQFEKQPVARTDSRPRRNRPAEPAGPGGKNTAHGTGTAGPGGRNRFPRQENNSFPASFPGTSPAELGRDRREKVLGDLLYVLARLGARGVLLCPGGELVVSPRTPRAATKPSTPIGHRIDDLFYLILIITTLVFIGTQIALGYVLWRGAGGRDENNAWFSHGSHNLEVIWTIVPSGILLFIALFQMDTWADYRVKSNYPEQAVLAPIGRGHGPAI